MSGLASTLALLRLSSSTLPIGAFAYSRGLEGAVHDGRVHDEASVARWILGLLEHSLVPVDGAIGARLHAAFLADDGASVQRWSAYLRACRESRELAFEDEQLGLALSRLLTGVGVAGADLRAAGVAPSHVGGYMLGCARAGVDVSSALAGFYFAFCESQVGAALRLLPFGQSAGQRVLELALPVIERCVPATLALADDELGGLAHGLALSSARHESQYSRLFRS